MKKLLFLCLLITIQVEAKTITLTIPDSDIKVVEHDVLDAEQWIRDAWAGKLNKCKQRLINQEIEKSMNESSALPAGEAAVIQKALNRPGYENRKQRDAREENLIQTRQSQLKGNGN